MPNALVNEFDPNALDQRLMARLTDPIVLGSARRIAKVVRRSTSYLGIPGPKGSMMKLLVTATHKALSEVVSDILGWDFLEFDGDRSAHPWTYEYLWSWVFSISGGTSEIQREITADRVLGLPKGR